VLKKYYAKLKEGLKLNKKKRTQVTTTGKMLTLTEEKKII